MNFSKMFLALSHSLTPIEHLDMERSPLSTESLAILIDFVIAHDSSIIQKLSNPIKLDVSSIHIYWKQCFRAIKYYSIQRII